MTSQQQVARANTYDLKRADGTVRRGVSPREIREMANAGNLYTDDYLTKSGEEQWRPASALAELPVRKRPVVAAAAPVAPDRSTAEIAELKSALAAAVSARTDAVNLLEEIVAERDGLVATCDALTAERREARADHARSRDSVAALESALAEAESQEKTLRHALAEAGRSQMSLKETHARDVAELRSAHQVSQTESEAALAAALAAARAEAAVHNDRALRQSIAGLTEDRDAALRRAEDAAADREELVAALAHAQDSIRVSDDLRRALEKTANSSKSALQEQTRDLAQARALAHELQQSQAGLMTRAEAAESASANAAQVHAEAREWVARATEQRDAALKAKDTIVSERDTAIADRDATRLAIGATQTDLVKTRRMLEELVAESQSLRGVIGELTTRASGLERALADSQAEGHEAAMRRDELTAARAALEGETTRLKSALEEGRRDAEALRLRLEEESNATATLSEDLGLARAESAALHGELAGAREAASTACSRATSLERDVADERSKIVARDELIFRESLRSEEREAEIRRLAGSIAGLKADLDTERRRADDAFAQVTKSQNDLVAARQMIAQQNAQMVDAHEEIEELTKVEQSVRAALAAAGAERDQASGALAAAQAEIGSREQQVAAERALREQAEASSRQLLASYERLSEEAGRRITDLEVRLTEAAHQTEAVKLREEHALASLTEAHAQAKVMAQRLQHVEEQRTAVVRDRDAYAKQLKGEAAARAAAEDKIAGANERAHRAEREGRQSLERAVQASMIALGGAKQRLDDDYTKSRAELEVLEQLVAEATNRVIATGGTVPGLPLMPREAAIAAKAAAEAAALIAAQVNATPPANAAKPATFDRKEVSDKPAAPPVTFRLIDAIADEVPPSRPNSRGPSAASAKRDTPSGSSELPPTGARVSQSPGAGRLAGSRERVSQPSRRSGEGSSDDDSSSSTSASDIDSSRLDRAWLDDHNAAETAEAPLNTGALLALTALGVVISASLAAVPKFSALDMRGAMISIAAWATGVPIMVGLVQLAALSSGPILSRRIPALAAALCVFAPLGTLAIEHAPGVAIALFAPLAALPWIVAAAAWPDARQLAATRTRDRDFAALDARANRAGIAAAALSLAALAAAMFPWIQGSTLAIQSAVGILVAALSAATAACALTPSLRARAALPAWGATLIALAWVLSTFASGGVGATLSQVTTACVIMLGSTWAASTAASLAAACGRERIERSLAIFSQPEAPALVAHERAYSAMVMASSAVLPLIPALCALRLVRGRSRRAESQMRSFADFEIWSAIAIGVALLASAFAHQTLGIHPLYGVLLAHAAITLGGAVSIAMDRFVRFPSPMPVIKRPAEGLDLPEPLVTVQRTADHSPNRPIVHPCATPAWALADVALGCVAVGTMTGSVGWATGAGTLLGLAAWLPSFVASRTRHQDTLIIGMLTTAMLVALACTGLVLGSSGAPQGTLLLGATAGAATGMWGLLLAWAASGARHMATATKSGLAAQLDDDGDPLAPTECPIAVRRRDEAIRRLAIGACAFAIAPAAVSALPVGAMPFNWTPVTVAGVLALVVVSTVATALALLNLETIAAHAQKLRAAMFTLAAIASAPIAFSIAEIGVIETVTAIPYSLATATLALVAGAILSGLVPTSPLVQRGPSAHRAPSPRAAYPRRAPRPLSALK